MCFLCIVLQKNILDIQAGSRKRRMAATDYEAFLKRMTKHAVEELERAIRGLNEGARYLVIPVNDTKKYHWTLLVYVAAEKCFVSWNSLRGRRMDGQMIALVFK